MENDQQDQPIQPLWPDWLNGVSELLRRSATEKPMTEDLLRDAQANAPQVPDAEAADPLLAAHRQQIHRLLQQIHRLLDEVELLGQAICSLRPEGQREDGAGRDAARPRAMSAARGAVG